MITRPEIAELSAMFRLDTETGKLYWRENRFSGRYNKTPTAKANTEAGCENGHGYRTIGIGLKHYQSHDLVFAIFHGRWPVKRLDHIDRDGLNNRPSNLREATQSQNMCNTSIPKNNKSGVKGVHWDKARSRWVASIALDRKTISLGYYDDLELAELVRSEAARKYHGAFARAS